MGGQNGGYIQEELTIRRVFLHYLHCSHDTRLFAVGMVEEGKVTFLHRAEVISS